MGKRRERLNEGNIIADLVREYDIQSSEYIQEALNISKSGKYAYYELFREKRKKSCRILIILQL